VLDTYFVRIKASTQKYLAPEITAKLLDGLFMGCQSTKGSSRVRVVATNHCVLNFKVYVEFLLLHAQQIPILYAD